MYSKSWAILMMPVCVLFLTNCGGPAGCPGGVFVSGGCTVTAPGGGGTGGSGGGGNKGGGGGSGALTTPVPVTVVSSQTSVADIAVATPSSTTPPNIKALGVDSNGFAYVTGGTATQGEAAGIVTLFGPGITNTMQVSFSGPSDVTVSNINGVTATDGTPGLQFNIAVAAGAALGGRTLILQNSNNDVTTFTGGIEIIP